MRAFDGLLPDSDTLQRRQQLVNKRDLIHVQLRRDNGHDNTIMT